MNLAEPSSKTDAKGKTDLLDAIFDLSFQKAITPLIIRWLYILGVVGCALLAGSWVLSAFNNGIMAGLISMVIAPVLFIVYVLVTRVGLEVVQAIFSIAESLKRIESNKRGF